MKGPLTLLVCAAAALATAGCGWINPNFQTVFNPAAETYTVSGTLTRGFSSRPKVAYILGEGNSPDPGSFTTRGQGAGLTNQGIYTPSQIVPLDANGRFTITFTISTRYGLVRLFAWDDANQNNVRDQNERLADPEYDIKKEDNRGWSYNAPDWNQFSFVFRNN